MSTISDPNGDRQCFQRWNHIKAKTIEREGALLCEDCVAPTNEN